MRNCEPSAERISGRHMRRARNPRIPKPEELYVSPMCRGDGCAVNVLSLTRGGPDLCPHDNCDPDGLSEAGRRSEAGRGIGRSHSSRKTTCRRPAWRHAERGKQDGSALGRREVCKEWRRRGERRSDPKKNHEKPAARRLRKPPTGPAGLEPCRKHRGKTGPDSRRKAAAKNKEAKWDNWIWDWNEATHTASTRKCASGEPWNGLSGK